MCGGASVGWAEKHGHGAVAEPALCRLGKREESGAGESWDGCKDRYRREHGCGPAREPMQGGGWVGWEVRVGGTGVEICLRRWFPSSHRALAIGNNLHTTAPHS